MRILVFHQYYLISGQPGGLRFNEFARLWNEAGHDVTVIAGALNYATGEVPPQYRGRWTTREKDGNVDVIRCFVPQTYSKSYVGRAWAYFGFTLSAITAAMKTKKPDIVIATSPPLTIAVAGWFAAKARLSRIPLVFEVRDLWPESAVTTGVLSEKSPLTRLLYAIERWSYRSADCINVLTPAFRDDIVRRGLAAAEKISFVPNGADVDIFRPGSRDNEIRRNFGWGDKVVALYAGAHGKANALQQLIGVAEELRARPDILVVCAGDGPERKTLAAEATNRGLTNISFVGPQPKERMPEMINACDIGLAVLQRNPTFLTVYPNKVFDYMACERPTVLAIDGVARKLVCDDARAGLFAEPEQPVDIAQKIRQLADNEQERQTLGRAGRVWVEQNASRESLAQRYLTVLHDTCCGSGARSACERN